MIGGYAYNEEGYKALDCFERMQKEGFLPNVITFLCILRVCGSTKAVDKGKQIHEEISTRGLLNQNSVVLGTALVDMYAKCGELVRAQELHDKLHVRDVVSWSALISGYANQGKSDEALICFERMQDEGIFPNSVTFICILKACGSKGAIEKGKQIHDEIVNMKLLEKDVVLGTALVDMYVKCGALARAQQILKELCVRDAVSWNALITGYVQKEQYYEALDCFDEMQSEGISPDLVTLTCIMKAAGSVGAIEKGNQIHGEIMRWGLLGKNAMIGNAVVDMYVKCGMLGKAQEVLEGLSVRDVISWSAIIAGHAQQGQGHEALNCFELMRSEGISPNVVTFICVLKACGSKGTIAKGEEIHDEIIKKDLLRKDIVLGNALVDMYVKCGALSRAYQVLEELPIRDVVSWSSLIAGHAKKRQGYEALECFQCMKGDGLSPDGVTFLCLLSACSQSGLLDEAQMCFGYMNKEIGITVGLEHHMHLVLVLGCAGYFDKAMSVIKTMPSSDYAPFWIAILDACKKLGNASFGRLAFDHAVQLNDACSPGNVLLSTLYPAASDERMSTLAVFGDGYS
jgi:pentatricopeptide repeat protein